MKKILVVGTGPSGFAVLNSIENLDNVWVMDGYTDFDNSKISARKHLGLKQKFGSSHTYVNTKAVALNGDQNFKLPISYSRGGFGEIWGNGFTPYKISDLLPLPDLGFDCSITKSMKELLNIIPFAHVPGALDQRFGKVEDWSDAKQFGTLESHQWFNNFLLKRNVPTQDGLLFGHPNLFLDSSKCTNCGLCLSGCPYGALFDPGEQLNKLVFSKKIDHARFIRGILKRIDASRSGATVIYTVNGEDKSEWFDEVILSTGPLSTALILMRSNLLPEKFDIPDSQVFYGAFLSLKRLRNKKEFKEVGQMVCYPEKKTTIDFQLSFYTPSELTRLRISQSIFPNAMQALRIPKVLSERIVPAIGFLPQEISGKIHIELTPDGFHISRIKNPASKIAVRTSLKKVSASLRQFGLLYFPLGTRIPAPGSGFHIGASLPLNGSHVDSKGYLIQANAVRILDASILPKIPAGAHTFLTMALIRTLIKGLP